MCHLHPLVKQKYYNIVNNLISKSIYSVVNLITLHQIFKTGINRIKSPVKITLKFVPYKSLGCSNLKKLRKHIGLVPMHRFRQ